MQLKNFSIFIKKTLKEGDRLQRYTIDGHLLTTRKFTDLQIVSLLVGAASLYFLPKGFTDNFAGFIISFLGIFIGLFTSIAISMYDKRKAYFEEYSQKNQIDKANLIKTKNYLVQFTGLTAYSILIALLLIILLSLVLLSDTLKQDICSYSFITSKNQINKETILSFALILFLCAHRFIVIYFLLIFFTITIFSITSYFSFLSTEYKNNKLKEND